MARMMCYKMGSTMETLMGNKTGLERVVEMVRKMDQRRGKQRDPAMGIV